jgi:hypothetical protein
VKPAIQLAAVVPQTRKFFLKKTFAFTRHQKWRELLNGKRSDISSTIISLRRISTAQANHLQKAPTHFDSMVVLKPTQSKTIVDNIL